MDGSQLDIKNKVMRTTSTTYS